MDSRLAERTQSSAKAFRFGLLAGNGMAFTPPAASIDRNAELRVAIIRNIAA